VTPFGCAINHGLFAAGGHLGIWAALGELWPQCEQQRCRNHEIMNVLDQVPKKQQAPQHLRGMMDVDSRASSRKPETSA